MKKYYIYCKADLYRVISGKSPSSDECYYIVEECILSTEKYSVPYSILVSNKKDILEFIDDESALLWFNLNY